MKKLRETLTPEEVEKIREYGRKKLRTYEQLARQFQVEIGHIKFIVEREDR